MEINYLTFVTVRKWNLWEYSKKVTQNEILILSYFISWSRNDLNNSRIRTIFISPSWKMVWIYLFLFNKYTYGTYNVLYLYKDKNKLNRSW